MLMSYFIVVLLLWLFIVVVAVTVSILVIVIIVVVLVKRIVLKRVETKKCKFDILIIITINVTYIGIYNGILPQDNKDSNESNSEL